MRGDADRHLRKRRCEANSGTQMPVLLLPKTGAEMRAQRALICAQYSPLMFQMLILPQTARLHLSILRAEEARALDVRSPPRSENMRAVERPTAMLDLRDAFCSAHIIRVMRHEVCYTAYVARKQTCMPPSRHAG